MNERPTAPPNSKESEMMVLGAMLSNINHLNTAADGLDDNDFYYSEHKHIFSVLKSAYRQDKPADVHLMAEELKRQDKLEAVGGVGYLTSLVQYAGTGAYIEEYTELVRNKAVLRRMILASQEVEKNALEDPQDVYGVLDEAQQKFFEISQSANSSAGVTIAELLSGTKGEAQVPYLEMLQKRQEEYLNRDGEEELFQGVPTHFNDLDQMLGGFAGSNLMILAARPAMGKRPLW